MMASHVPGPELPAHLELSTSVVAAEVGGEIVLLDTVEGVYYALNAVGAAAWRLLGEHVPMAEVVKRLLTQFQVDESRLVADLGRFSADLQRLRLARVPAI